MASVVLALACSSEPETQAAQSPAPLVDLVASVDTRVGTGGGGYAQGQVFVGAQLPFGMVRPGPDTAGYMGDVGFAHTAGYWYLDDIIEGFSQLHLHGTGVEDLGNFLMMPTLGMESSQTSKAGYQKPFRHETETAVPGYYAVTLDEIDVRAELTASVHSAVHRYTFPAETATPTVVVDFGHGIGIEEAPDAELTIDAAAGEVSGWMLNAGRFTGRESRVRSLSRCTVLARAGKRRRLERRRAHARRRDRARRSNRRVPHVSRRH